MTIGSLSMALLVLAGAEPRPCSAELFRITRNTNANVVVYEARLAVSGLDPGEPVHAAWLMLAEDGHREELTLLERELAYGVVLQRDSSEVRIALRAQPDLSIRIVMEQGCPVARTWIQGRDARLRRVAVEATGGIFPGVAHLDLHGEDVASGAEARERIVPAP